MDNSAAERVALGRKNYLFAGSDAGGEQAAAIYRLLGTAEFNGLDPELYLRHVLERVADHPINRLQELPALEPQRRPSGSSRSIFKCPSSKIRGHLRPHLRSQCHPLYREHAIVR
jgi:hypothetical protein